ncbi:hypothetical protein D0C36_23015 [Mucilaginibacter conchicola]|uniref:MobA/VirD2-like nuclease domain-containing protein n=1 Tax=Mucilaginibacter conchicola TaxID=2303333 RepID=A0A372NME4_9SPHI|nr:relaxase/mobilization nuclease domain-containing protein [Mucilaginibacter conchicola]RFZ90116.1 hypothetical protein D0C36_23015 [Mucilaginibacter conchicola]
MVAKIKTGKSLKGAISYNEHKVMKGSAKLISANGFFREADDLTYEEKVFRLQDLAGRNQRVTTNTLHVSLNFDPSESLDDDRLTLIAERYMDGIGFGGQPYLVYRHTDAGHPHIHIVSTNVDSDGNRISFHNLGKFRSESTRKQIEKDIGLVQAESGKPTLQLKIPGPVIYGDIETKGAIRGILTHVLKNYRFASLAELNVALARFNIMADRGSKDSLMYKHGGLRYWITDNAGIKLGVPIKASLIDKRSMIRSLDKQYVLNRALRHGRKQGVADKIEQALDNCTTMKDFQLALYRNDVYAAVSRNDDGRIYGITFVDHDQKVVFKGSDLGKGYSVAAICDRLAGDKIELRDHRTEQQPDGKKEVTVAGAEFFPNESLLALLLSPADYHPEQAQENLFRKKKKKKRQLKH